MLLLLGALVVGGLWGPQDLRAQAPSSPTLLDRLEQIERIDQVPVGVLRAVAQRHPERLSDNQRARLRRARAERGRPASKVALSNLTIERSLQSFYGSDWPRQDLNFVPNEAAIPAGDVNGDGTNDWIYRSFAADGRTGDLSDRVTKTLLTYGGDDFGARYYDDLYYRSLVPVGNFVGSANADAIQTIDGGIRIYRGTSRGYVRTARNLEVPPSPQLAADVNGDGYSDLIATSSFNPTITIVYGAEDAADVTTATFEPAFGAEQEFSYAADEVDDDGEAEIVRLAGDTGSDTPGDSLVVDVFSLASSGDGLVEDQELTVESQTRAVASNVKVDLPNIDGSGLREILVKQGGNTFQTIDGARVFTSTLGEYDADPIRYDAGVNGDLIPVGDLNDDGRTDFVFDDGENVVIGFGPETVSDGLTSDLSFDSDAEPVTVPFADLSPTPFGDLTGDGTDDLIAQVNPSEQVGSRLVEVADDGSSMETTDILFDEEPYSRDGVQHTVNVGDWDGDGTDDVAFVLSDGRIEIYYGDPTQSPSPDVTLEGPRFARFGNANGSSVAAGDFTGNGEPNLAVAWQSASQAVAVYGPGDGDSPLHTISLGDLGIAEDAPGIDDPEDAGPNEQDGPNGVVANLGDINGDGTADLGITQPEVDTSTAQKVFLYFGGSSLSTQPDETVDYTDRSVGANFGQVLRGVGDINGDGTDDFLVGDTDTQFQGPGFPSDPFGFGSGAYGALFVHYGEQSASPSFGDADEILAIPLVEGSFRVNAFFGFGGVAVGDFNGDDTTDVAAKPGSSTLQGEGAQAIRVFYGGENFDGTPDAELPVPGLLDTFSDGELARVSFGAVTSVPPASDDGPDRLMLETWTPSNALIYGPGPDGSSVLEKTTLLRGPDQNSGLGTGSNFVNFPQNASSAVGDFNNNGATNLVMAQLQSADFRGAPAYTYELGAGAGDEPDPVASSTESLSSPAGQRVDFGGTGTSIAFSDSTEGSGEVTVNRFDRAPDGTGTIGADNVSEYRVEISTSGDLSVGDSTEIRFDVSMLEGVSSPSQVSIYTRELSGVGSFRRLDTQFDEEDGELFALVSGFSEFAFGSDTEPLFSYPDTLAADASQTFGDASGPGDYRLVALPGAVDRSLSETLSGEAGTEWRAYWDDGSSEDYLVRHDGSDTFDFRPGRGFWVTSTEGWSVEDTLETVSLTGESTSISLNGDSTWTIVSNPFDRSVLWRSVLAANATSQPLWRFDGTNGFVRADTMQSAATGEAYYFFNDTGLDSLSIPYPSTGLRKADAETPTRLAVSATPAEADGPASTVHVGLSDGPTRSVVAPPGQFEPVSLRLKAREGTGRAQFDMVQVRPSTEEGGRTFSLRLQRRTDGPVQLRADHLSDLPGRSAALLVPATGQSYDLRRDAPITLTASALGGPDEKTPLKLAVGSADYVDEQAQSVIPDKVRLTSYPNPVGQQGTVEYALPEPSEVTLRVYDVLGREVATLARGEKQAGRHRVALPTRQLSSGVYFGRLRAGDTTRTVKVTVVK